MKDFIYTTEEQHANNSETMDDFLEYHLPYMKDDFEIIMVDGTYAEIKRQDGVCFEVHAGGNGDFNNHKIEFKEIKED